MLIQIIRTCLWSIVGAEMTVIFHTSRLPLEPFAAACFGLSVILISCVIGIGFWDERKSEASRHAWEESGL